MKQVLLVLVLVSGCGVPASIGSGGGTAAWMGDSLSNFYQHSAGKRPPERLWSRLVLAHWVVHNHGVSGSTAAQIRARWTHGVRGSGYDALVFLGGTNDVAAGYSGATAWGSIRDTVEEAQRDGLFVVLLTVPPWGNASVWTAAKQGETDLLNTRIREWCTRTDTPCVDAYAAFGRADRPDALASAYDHGDGVHLAEDAGNEKLVDLVCGQWPVACSR